MINKSFYINLGLIAGGILVNVNSSPVLAESIKNISFFAETAFSTLVEDPELGLIRKCASAPSVCAINGKGSLSGFIQFDKLEIFNSSNTNLESLLFEANYNGLVNSLPNQPKVLDIEFTNDSITSFSILGLLTDPKIVLEASINNIPEFSRGINLRINNRVTQSNLVMFSLTTPLDPSISAGGSRILSEGFLEIKNVSIPEPNSILGILVISSLFLIIKK